MKKTILKMLIITICLSVLFPVFSAPTAAVETDPVIRVGLYYGSNALPAANLENASGYGSGFRLGYFDGNRNFISTGSVDTVSVAVLKDRNMYAISSGGRYDFYDYQATGYTSVVGAYHIQPTAVYSSFEEAAAKAAEYEGAFPAYVNGEHRIRVGNYTTYDAAAEAAVTRGFGSYTIVGSSDTCYTVMDRVSGRMIYEFEYSGAEAFGIQPDITGAADVQTWFKGIRYRGAFGYKRMSGNDITVINYVSIHDYVKGILPYEMSSSWPIEALKAQALAAKSYTMCSLDKHSRQGFDLCNTTDCQVYRGTNLASANSDAAVDATWGLYVLYNGEPAQCFYYSSNGGASEDAANVWSADVPYLKGVVDPYETHGITYEHTFTGSQLGWLLQAKGYANSGTIVRCYVSQRTAVGNVYSLTMVDSYGRNFVFSKESARNIFYSETLGNIYTSQRFSVITTYADGTTTGDNAAAGSTVYVNGADSGISDFTNIYAIGGDGTALIGNSSAEAITGSGQISTVSPSGSGGDAPNPNKTAVSFTVRGSGYGHNVGLSQWGAYDMAMAGYTYDQILRFYFTGVTIGR